MRKDNRKKRLLEENPIQSLGDNQRVSICAGSLINENYVLTAVHCVDELRLGAINMKL